MNIALSNTDILKKVDCKFLLNNQLNNITDINILLPKTLLLYQPAKIGHFTCVFSNREGINYFDSYGTVPDTPLKWYPDNHEAGFTFLTKLLTKPNSIIYNEKKLQSKNTSTCGHWCCIRLIYSNLTNEEFNSCFDGIKNKDELIVKLYESF